MRRFGWERGPGLGLPLLLLQCLCLALTIFPARAFKEHDFKKCKDAGFCRRQRGQPGPLFDVVDVQLNGSVLSAGLRNRAAPHVPLQLSLSAFADGFLRLTVDEPAQVGRYKVLDIAQSEVEARRSDWQLLAQDDAHVSLSTGTAALLLQLSPFSLAVSVGGVPAITLNSRQLFNFEHRRVKEEGVECDGCWTETFLQFTDSKPKGPEAMSLDIGFPGFEHVYGLPERATSFALKPTPADSEPYRLYNLDVFEYLDESPFGLYGSIPMLLAHKLGLTVGVLWLNAAEMFVDVRRDGPSTHTQWMAESGIVELYLLLGPSPQQVLRQYGALTGTTALPQMFAIGYHQCRWNYNNDADVRMVDAGFDTHEIPYDVIWLDIEHTSDKRYLTWNYHFPQPQELQDSVAIRTRRTVTIVDPHVKRDPGYYIFSQAQAAGYLVKNAQGGEFEGWCWPGSSSYLDVTSPDVRSWWAQQLTLDKYQGSTQHLYIWNDMNEPSVFNGPEITMHKDVLHYGNVEHRDIHNLYGLYYHMGTAAGLELRGQHVYGEDGDRPFVLSRAFFAGTQRVGPIWTGDNKADWKHLAVSVPMLLTLGVTGLTFSGADVGGFFGNPDPELLTRWYQVGAYYPFFRGHAHIETARREPWLFGEETTARIRDAIRERYALLPYIYTLFRHANVTGQPVLRPLWFEFPDAPDTFSTQEEFMLGPALLVRPVLAPASASTHVDTLLPQGTRWYSTASGAEQPLGQSKLRLQLTMDAIPVFYRGGYIVPRRERPRRSTYTQTNDPLTLVVALGHDLKAQGELYLDDGRSFAFMRGEYLHRDFSFSDLKLSNSAHPTEPGTPPGSGSAQGLRFERIVFLGLPPPAGAGGSYSALSPTSAELLPLEPGGGGWGPGALLLRQPWLLVEQDWTLDIVPTPAAE